MVQFFSQQFSFAHEWTKVTIGVWQKYPNDSAAHVTCVDTIDRSVDPETGIIRTERVVGCKQSAPKWAMRMLGGQDDAYVREVSFIDPSTRRMKMYSVNLSLSQYLTVLESISYTPSASNPTKQTTFTQSAEIVTRGALWKSFADKLEAFSLEQFIGNAAKGRIGFENVLSSLWDDGPVKARIGMGLEWPKGATATVGGEPRS